MLQHSIKKIYFDFMVSLRALFFTVFKESAVCVQLQYLSWCPWINFTWRLIYTSYFTSFCFLFYLYPYSTYSCSYFFLGRPQKDSCSWPLQMALKLYKSQVKAQPAVFNVCWTETNLLFRPFRAFESGDLFQWKAISIKVIHMTR